MVQCTQRQVVLVQGFAANHRGSLAPSEVDHASQCNSIAVPFRVGRRRELAPVFKQHDRYWGDIAVFGDYLPWNVHRANGGEAMSMGVPITAMVLPPCAIVSL